MRKAILFTTLFMAVGGTLSLPAQQNPPSPVPLPIPMPLARSLYPHPRPGSNPPPRQMPPAKQPQTKSVTGPVLDATTWGASLVLDKGWRVGISRDPEAASPDFDDSTWALRDAAETIEEVPDPREGPPEGLQNGPKPNRPPGQGGNHRVRFAWFRLHLHLAPNHGPVALLIELPVARSTTLGIGTNEVSINVYANGKLIAPEGPHGSNLQRYQQISRLYKLNVPPQETSLTLAIQTPHFPFGYGAYTHFFSNRTLRLGSPDELQRRLMVWNDGTLFERIPRLVYSVVLIVLAAFLFVLYFAQRGHNEYLWLAMHELAQAPIGLVEFAGSTARLDSLWYAATSLQLMVVSAYLFFEFLISFLGLKRRWYMQTLRYTAPVLALVAPTLLLVGHSTAIGLVLAFVLLCSALWILGYLIFVFVTLIAASVRRNFEAGLLLIPLVMSLVGTIEPAVTEGINEFTNRPERAALTFSTGPIPIHMTALADYTGVLAIVIIIFLRFLHIQQDQQHASSELAAARSVQELLIPPDKVSTPGFEVNAVYNPANEVGGDFYHVQPMSDGGMLVVIGDVAGKGLQAAMNVSMIMGALRRTAEKNPALVLTALNRVLAGNDSFTTCQAAWFGKDGEVTLANAGHLPPYMNSQEIAVPGSLPLGVLAEVNYEEVHIYLHPGDRLLMFSDGVVEARKPTGELFGFDRVHNMSNQSAFFIADAAKDFGQADDITVLTVRRRAEPEAAERGVQASLKTAEQAVS